MVENASMSSQEKKVKTIHDALKPLYLVSRLLCVWPYKYEIFNKALPLSARNKLISYLLSIYIATNLSWLLYRYVIVLEANFGILNFVILPYHLLEHILAVISMLKSARCDYRKSFFVLLDGLNQNELFRTLEFHKIQKKILLCLGISFTMLTTNLIIIIVLTTAASILLLSSFYVAQIIHVTFFAQVVCQMQILIVYLQKVNADISKIFADSKCMVKFIEEDECKLNRLGGLLRAHGKICNLIKVINDFHGAQLVLSYCSTVLLNLFCLYGCIVDAKQAIKNEISWERATFVIAERIYNLIFMNGMLLVLASNSTRLKNEAENTTILAGDVINQIAVEDDDCEYNRAVTEKLKTFMEQAAFRNTNVTGAGIFIVDLTVVSSVVAAVTSYFIVILQFREN